MISFDITFPDFSDLSERGLNRAHKEAGTAAATWFMEERLPLRFTDTQVQSELGWPDRDEKYQASKLRIKKRVAKHNFSGATAGKAKRGARVRVTKKFIGVKIDGLGVQYGRVKPKSRGGTRVNLRKELGIMSKREQQRFATIYRDKLVEALQNEIDKQARRRG